MKSRIKSTRRDEKGFTLIEILIIIVIMAILLSVILVSISSARTKAENNAVYTSFKSTASAAYMCLLSGSTGINLSTPSDGSLPYLCMSGGTPVMGYSAWPSMVKNKWTYGNGLFTGDGFYWCNLNNSSPPVSCGVLLDGVCGQSSGSGSFCYGIKKESRGVWCTQDGCHKVGF